MSAFKNFPWRSFKKRSRVAKLMEIEKTPLEGLLITRSPIHRDARGFLTELCQFDKLKKAIGYDPGFTRIILSDSERKGVLRGLHAEPWNKLIYFTHGSVLSAIADIRPESPTFGKVRTGVIDDKYPYGLYIPQGFANGFCALTDKVRLIYFVSGYYKPSQKKRSIIWNDPDLNILWPLSDPILSEEDQKNLTLREVYPAKFP